MQMIYYRMKEESQQTWEDEGERGTYQLSWTLFFVVQDNVGTVRQFFFRYRYSTRTAGPGLDDPEHDGSRAAETKIVTIVLPSCIILKL